MTDGVTDLRTEQFRIRNYRVLRDVVLKDITPLTALCGANGSGKSTVIDVFAFLHAAFTTSLRPAWDVRNRLAEIRSRGQEGPVGIAIKYRSNLDGTSRLATYSLEVGQARCIPVVRTEQLRWTLAPALRAAHPRVPRSLAARQKFRVSDDIRGGTREALEHFLQSHCYHSSGLRKMALASDVARHLDGENNRSASFCCLRDGLRLLASGRVSA